MKVPNCHQAQSTREPWCRCIHSQRFGQVLLSKALDENHQPIIEVEYQTAHGFSIVLLMEFIGNWRLKKQRQLAFFAHATEASINDFIVDSVSQSLPSSPHPIVTH